MSGASKQNLGDAADPDRAGRPAAGWVPRSAATHAPCAATNPDASRLFFGETPPRQRTSSLLDWSGWTRGGCWMLCAFFGGWYRFAQFVQKCNVPNRLRVARVREAARELLDEELLETALAAFLEDGSKDSRGDAAASPPVGLFEFTLKVARERRGDVAHHRAEVAGVGKFNEAADVPVDATSVAVSRRKPPRKRAAVGIAQTEEAKHILKLVARDHIKSSRIEAKEEVRQR
mmetsp:Transcript_13266/g.44344  ORF Transcript_13266/g.44344 Transcript_13266/m.44344 type:complete len:232 (+) Transcript_13266:428-1123(+)